MNTNQNPSDYKVVAVINKKLDTGPAMNTIAHLGLGLSSLVGDTGRKILQFLDFEDHSGGVHPSISARSLVVLEGSEKHIREFRKTVIDKGIIFVDFTETMTGGDYLEQLDKTKRTTDEGIVYFGLMVLGLAEELKPMTRKFSLWH